jgi:hypothetical protein
LRDKVIDGRIALALIVMSLVAAWFTGDVFAEW